MRFLPSGAHALLVELDGLDEVWALAAEVERRRGDGFGPQLHDVVPGARTLLLDGLADPAATARELSSWGPPAAAADATDAADGDGDGDGDGDAPVEIRCDYDGPDLEVVARSWGMSADEAAARHRATEFRVAFCGFAPGFAYLAGLGAERPVPRRDSPRTTIPAGSVALAGEYCGIYPRASPGGWQLIGRTDAPLWNSDRDPPALLTPGTRVRFVAR